MGRRRIAIEEIKESNKRYVTFTKRRQGLFKKADTASRMYGSQIGVIVFSPTGRLYTSGPVDSVIHQFLHQSSSSSSSSYLNLNLEEHTSTGGHIEDDGNKMRSRSRGADDDMMLEERETKKRKLLMMMSTTTTTTTTEAATAAAADDQEEENEEFLLIKKSETEQEGLMKKNEFIGIEQNVTELEEEEEEEVLLEESQISREEETNNVDYNMGSSSSTVVTTTTSQLDVASSSSFLESVHDGLAMDEFLNGFADYILSTGHPYEERTMFDLLPHQGVYDDDNDVGCFTFCDNWPAYNR